MHGHLEDRCRIPRGVRVAACLALALVVTGAQAASAATWHQVPSAGDPGGSSLTGVSSIPGGNSWWAVGGSAAGTLVERGGQAGLTAVPSPSPGTGAGLEAVSAVSRSSAWAVGSYTQADGRQHTLILHWDGISWQVSPSPDVPGRFPALVSVVALSRTNVWAVGSRKSREFVAKTLAEHWNGRRWKVVPSQDPPGPNGHRADSLASICRVPGTNALWAVGGHGGSHGGRPLVEQWTGKVWASVPVPTGLLPKNGMGVQLTGVAASKRFVLAVGFFNNFANGHVLPIALVRTPRGWVVAHPVPVLGAQLNAVTHVPGTRTFWTVGFDVPTSGPVNSFAERWDARSWRAFQITGVNPPGDSGLSGARATGNGSVLAVGGISASPEATLAEIWS